ncbi:thermonuclease family protein [Pseudogemmobacter humi]|uniref:thermonuclease family protein n=1 Tax=Pseudogemmobacter humi TaxID=2483812 RepID=UPI000F5250C2|nr:thermonuclease family protein [Pseudogemmobacter humi]
MLFLGFMAVERFPEHLGSLPELTARRMIEGAASHIRDGDTIEVSGVPVRFGSLDCAERNTRAGQIAAARMRELVTGQVLVCALNGRSSHDRSIGRCTLPDGSDLAARMIREGLCGRYW